MICKHSNYYLCPLCIDDHLMTVEPKTSGLTHEFSIKIECPHCKAVAADITHRCEPEQKIELTKKQIESAWYHMVVADGLPPNLKQLIKKLGFKS